MNAKVFVLALTAFITGMAELSIGGILPEIADGLHVSVSAAGQLISVFAIVLAIAGPVMLTLTARWERKRLYLWALSFFFIGNLVAFASPNYEWLIISRIFTALSCALITVMAITIVPNIVAKSHQARALGIVYMGISGSLVLGVPIGVIVSDYFGWRAPFLLIAMLTLISMMVIYYFLPSIPPKQAVPLREQLASLKNTKLISAHLIIVFMLAGHYTLYAYFNPFLQETLKLDSLWISIAYFVFGMAAVAGGAVGGWLSDRWNTDKSMLIIVAGFAIALAILPFTTYIPFVFPFALVAWAMLSWAISPPMQSYLIRTAPRTADIQQSLNTSALQIGIAVGSVAGGAIIRIFPIQSTAWFGAGFVVLAFGSTLFSLAKK